MPVVIFRHKHVIQAGLSNLETVRLEMFKVFLMEKKRMITEVCCQKIIFHFKGLLHFLFAFPNSH